VFFEKGAEHRNSRGRDSGYARCLAKRLGANLQKPVDNFARQPGNAVEGKTIRDATPFLPAHPLGA
jgi:hypothetical protein